MFETDVLFSPLLMLFFLLFGLEPEAAPEGGMSHPRLIFFKTVGKLLITYFTYWLDKIRGWSQNNSFFLSVGFLFNSKLCVVGTDMTRKSVGICRPTLETFLRITF